MNATHQAIEAVWRIEAGRLIAGLARIVRDVGLAEELAQDALVAALEQWPASGVPENPGAWLMATAKHRAIDRVRRDRRLEKKQLELGRARGDSADPAAEIDAALDDDIGDDLLRLVFTACHPVLVPEARVALTLRLLGGLTTGEIARAFLVPEPTIAQRIVRAKRALAEADVPFEVPRGDELAPRLASVLEVVYLIFNEGYSATAGDDWMRPGLCEDALRNRGLRHEERARDLGRREPAKHAQGQSDACLHGKHGMTRNEHQAQQVVTDLVIERGIDRFAIVDEVTALGLDFAPELLVLAPHELRVAHGVDRAMLRRLHEPGAGLGRNALVRPLLECRHERFLRKLLGLADVAHHAREAGDELRPLDAKYRFDCGMRRRLRHRPKTPMPSTGRTSSSTSPSTAA